MFAATGKQIRIPKIEIPHAPRLKTSVRVDFDMGRVEKAVAVGDRLARSKAGQAVRRQARSMIRKNRRPSLPGRPPHTRQGRLRRSILYSAPATEPEVIIGPAAHIVSRTGHYHEFGGMQIRRFPRKKYAIGKPGPIRENPNYTVEAQRYLRYKSRSFNTKVKAPQKAVFTRIRTPKQLARAKRLDLQLWPQTKIKYNKYPQRPFMAPALQMASETGVIAKSWEGVIQAG